MYIKNGRKRDLYIDFNYRENCHNEDWMIKLSMYFKSICNTRYPQLVLKGIS